MLNYKDLYDGFFDIIDNNSKYSESLESVAKQWSNVFQNFYINQIVPIPGSSNLNLFPSLRIFESGLIAAMYEQTIKQQFEILVETLHLGVCMGVTMTGIYITTPPTSILKLQHCFNSKLPISSIANLLASTIFTWVQFTFSTQISSGIIIKWM